MRAEDFELEEEREDEMTEEEAQRLVKWVIEHGHTEAEAYEALAYVMGATVVQMKNTIK